MTAGCPHRVVRQSAERGQDPIIDANQSVMWGVDNGRTMVPERFAGIVGRVQDWWERDEDGAALGGPALDPAYNGWYVTAIPSHAHPDEEDVDEAPLTGDHA